MGLSARERSALDAIARQFSAEEPVLARDLAEHGDGAVTSERIVQPWDAWPVLLIAVCLAVFALALLMSGTPDTLSHASIR
ncbi:MAG: DUF3040 domain-containing protein [Nonomuraea sp.]|nr:DUF3040 domain-containing protein [Nonomuraea sp.]